MYSTNPHQQLLQAIANLSDQEIPIVLQFISSLETQANNYPTKPQTVLERMGGYPKFLLLRIRKFVRSRCTQKSDR